MPREGGYGGADYGEGGAHENDPAQDELSRQRRQRHDEIADTRYLVHSATDHVVVQRGMSVDAFVGVAAGDQFAVFVKVFLHAVIIAGRLPRRSTLSCHTVPRRAASC